MSFAQTHRVVLWGRNADEMNEMSIRRENRRYLPEIKLPDSLELCPSFAETAADADLHLVVTPLAGLGEATRRLRQLHPGVPLLWACRLEKDSGKLPHEIVFEELGDDTPCGVLTGLEFCRRGRARSSPTAITLASADTAFAEHWVSHSTSRCCASMRIRTWLARKSAVR